MGTRNTTMVILNEEVKVAQYGQWDGYPSGQGSTALEFLRECDLEVFKDKVSKLSTFTDEEVDKINGGDWEETHPYLSRDWGAKVLGGIYYNKLEKEETNFRTNKREHKVYPVRIEKLVLDSEFPKNSLFCEWAYVIDLDNNKLEVYKGWNDDKPLTEEDRFYFDGYKSDGGYYPVRIVGSYDLNDLPDYFTFCNECDPPEEEEE